MIDIDFSEVEQLSGAVSALAERLSDYSSFWNDFAAGLVSSAVRDVFGTEGYGTWVPLDPATARAKAVSGQGARILERTGTYLGAATELDHPGNVFQATPTELIFGVSGDYFAARLGENYPERHEEGIGVPMRPVFGLLAEDTGFDAEVASRLDDWTTDEITETEREYGLS